MINLKIKETMEFIEGCLFLWSMRNIILIGSHSILKVKYALLFRGGGGGGGGPKFKMTFIGHKGKSNQGFVMKVSDKSYIPVSKVSGKSNVDWCVAKQVAIYKRIRIDMYEYNIIRYIHMKCCI